ncbi:tRNA adenosine(34) deaminase TadA [Candidatus Nitrosacidococcus tergens]|uniref:tRNA-specific adenosine deaminase n=1 Tax=Candidatus Nitrosacidococcus tergens TaxID=553981 RepID=A0A7G1QBQ8_9GAMM|nr:tRNA adenosine(34) deaminase TadA [Candidatus Nitrosacidococcus tergens]CAB1277371.1 tRNA-specific adenosine deaminase [Candidatus Nitrosacidococcus tergens]
MNYALVLARYAKEIGEVPIGAVLVKDGEILGEGWNCPITTNDPTAHAEIQAIRAGGNNLKNYRLINSTLYTTLEPCSMCAGAAIQARVKRIVFGAFDPKSGAAGTVINIFPTGLFNHSIEIRGGVLADLCGSVLTAFFKVRR